jgi:hypothetical protein
MLDFFIEKPLGIDGYDLASPADRAFAFDYDHSGKLDHIALYRPATGTMWILKNENGNFSPVYAQGDPGNGIGGYDLRSPADRAFAFDYDHSGKLDHIALYRPGKGTIWILKNAGGQFTPVYRALGIVQAPGEPQITIQDMQHLISTSTGAPVPTSGCADLKNTQFANNLTNLLKENLADLGSAEIDTLECCLTDIKIKAQIHWKHRIANIPGNPGNINFLENTITLESEFNPIMPNPEQTKICIDLPPGFGSLCITAREVAEVIAALV